jgi:hypothetical protein
MAEVRTWTEEACAGALDTRACDVILLISDPHSKFTAAPAVSRNTPFAFIYFLWFPCLTPESKRQEDSQVDTDVSDGHTASIFSKCLIK